MKRGEKIEEIMKHAEIIGTNKTTLLFVLAFSNDREITKFHKKFLEIKPTNEKRTKHIPNL